MGDTVGSPRPTWSGAILRTRHSIFGVLIVGGCALSVCADVLTTPPRDPIGEATALALFALASWAVVSDLRLGCGRLRPAVALVSWLGGLGLAAIVVPPARGDTTWWPTITSVVMGAWLLARWRSVVRAAGAALAVGLALTLQAVATPAPTEVISPYLLVRASQHLGVLAVCGFVIWALTGVAGRVDETDRIRDLHARVAADRSAGHPDLHRLIHDEVLPVLRLVSFDHAAISKAAIASSSARLARLLGQDGEAPEPVEENVLEALRRVHVDGLAVGIRGAPVLLPPHVVATLVAATTEALRNVRRHAGVSSARITVTPVERLGVRVTVHDGGRGFDPQASSRRGGLRCCVIERMRDAGGTAEVSSRVGDGTTVRLTWQPPIAPRDVDGDEVPLGPRAVRGLLLALSVLPVCSVAEQLLLREAFDPSWVPPVSAATLAVTTLWVATRTVVPSRAVSAALISLGIVAGVAVAASVAVPTVDTAHLAIVAPAAAPSLQMLLLRPRREGVLGCVLLSCIMAGLATALDDGRPSPQAVTILLVPLVACRAGTHLRRVFHDLDGSIRTQQAAYDCELAVARRARRVRRLLTDAIERTAPGTRDLVAGLARGERDPDDIGTRAEADLLARQLREELEVGSAHHTRAAIQLARTAGWEVHCRIAPDPPPSVDLALAQLLSARVADRRGPCLSAHLAAHPVDQQWRISLLVRDERHPDEPPLVVRRNLLPHAMPSRLAPAAPEGAR